MNKSTDKNEHAKKVVNAWEDFWYEHSQYETKIDKKGSSGIVEKIKQFLIHNEEEYNLDRRFKEILLKELPKEGKLCILEAGCGEGKTAMGIWETRFFMVALDISNNALQRTIAHSKSNKISLVPLRGSLFEIPCKDCSFDIILSVGVLDYFFPDGFV